MFNRSVWLLSAVSLGALLVLAACSQSGFQTDVGAGIGGAEDNTCSPPDSYAEHATEPAQQNRDEGYSILPNGRKITPAGEVIDLHMTFPWGLVLSSDGRYAYITATGRHVQSGGTGALAIVDLEAKEVVQIDVGKVANGVVLSPDGTTLYVSGAAAGNVHVVDVSDPPNYAKLAEIELCEGYVSGLAISPDGTKLYALNSVTSKIHVIDLTSEFPQNCEPVPFIKVGYYPREIVVSRDGKYAYVSNWAGNTVSIVDLEGMQEIAQIEVGKSPEGLALSGDGQKLFVANADSSNVSVIDLDSNTVSFTIELEPDTPHLKAMACADLLLDASNSRLYVACAQMNAVYLVNTDAADYPVFGKLPTGAYPTKLAMIEGSGKLIIANGHGWGSSPNAQGSSHSPENAMPGTLQILELPTTDAELADLTHQVELNNSRPLTYYDDVSCERLIPLDENPIKHVVLIVKENKTYDEVLGDLRCNGTQADPNGEPRGDGDPNLTLFGYDITPNTHRLACAFTNFDNFYSDAEVSVQGHLWTTQADCNDYLNKLWFDQLAMAGIEPATRSETGSIFDKLKEYGISFRNYAEGVSFIPEVLDEYAENYDQKVSFYNQGISDVEKALEVVREMRNGIFPQFIYISLPNDHTYGGAAGKPCPQWMVADNDYGLGILIDAISHSEYWESTIIFVIEDDPQSAAGDHIDAHRSLCLAISPWVKRGYLSSVHYSYPSLFRTIEMLLGIPPLNRNTATAAPMYDIFTTDPDFTPYEHVRPDVEYCVNPAGTLEAELSAKYDFTKIDGHAGLGEIIWRIMRPGQERPPYAKVIDE